MLIILIGTYIFVLTTIIWFLVTTKIHVYKFKNFSENIEKYSKLIFSCILWLTILGFICIFYINSSEKNSMVDEETSVESVYY